MRKVSIVMGARGRPNATCRTLKSYTKLSYPNWELLFMDVIHFGISLEKVVKGFEDKLPIRYIPLQEDMRNYIPDVTTWTPATTWNTGIRASTGDFVITCSADILLSYPGMIENFLGQYRGNRLSVTTYHLTADMTNALDTIDWLSNPDSVKDLPGFWDTPVWCESCNTAMGQAGLVTFITGQPKERWEHVGMFRTELSHLVNDQDLMLRDRALGRGVDTLENYYGYHQSHNAEPDFQSGVENRYPGWTYQNEQQARLLEPAKRDAA
jgi:hypothetical protein